MFSDVEDVVGWKKVREHKRKIIRGVWLGNTSSKKERKSDGGNDYGNKNGDVRKGGENKNKEEETNGRNLHSREEEEVRWLITQ